MERSRGRPSLRSPRRVPASPAVPPPGALEALRPILEAVRKEETSPLTGVRWVAAATSGVDQHARPTGLALGAGVAAGLWASVRGSGLGAGWARWERTGGGKRARAADCVRVSRARSGERLPAPSPPRAGAARPARFSDAVRAACPGLPRSVPAGREGRGAGRQRGPRGDRTEALGGSLPGGSAHASLTVSGVLTRKKASKDDKLSEPGMLLVGTRMYVA